MTYHDILRDSGRPPKQYALPLIRTLRTRDEVILKIGRPLGDTPSEARKSLTVGMSTIQRYRLRVFRGRSAAPDGRPNPGPFQGANARVRL
jgi:hypothetical protein